MRRLPEADPGSPDLRSPSRYVLWLATRFRQTSPRFSPDGRWIAYESNESGDTEIYLALTDGGQLDMPRAGEA